jgi:hypothetical protein
MRMKRKLVIVGLLASLVVTLVGSVAAQAATEPQLSSEGVSIAAEVGVADRQLFRELRRAEIGALAETLGLTPQELRDELQSGTTLRELLRSQGVGPRQALRAVLGAAREVLAQAVEDGRITPEQARKILKFTALRFIRMLRGGGPGDGGDEDLSGEVPS